MRTSRRPSNPTRDSARGPTPEPTPSADRPTDGADRLGRCRDFVFRVAILVLATLWTYAPVYHGDWLWDDDSAITANPVTQGPWSFRKIWVAPPGADYFPLTATGFWIPWRLLGPRPGMTPPQTEAAIATVRTVYHAMNILLHLLGALALWRLLHVMKLPGAWIGGLLFALHPVCVESVAWVSELKNTLSHPLLLLACACFVQFDDERAPARSAGFYAASVLLFLFAMFAKTAAVMFPFVILAYGWWKHDFPIDRRGITALLLAGASLCLTVIPEFTWLRALRGNSSSWLLFSTCMAIAVLGPITSAALAFAIATRAAPPTETSAGGGKTLERYVLVALPFFWISVVLGIATCYFQWTRAIGEEAIPVGGIGSKIATAGMAVLFYLWKSAVPIDLLAIYPRWNVDPPQVWQFLPWPILIAAAWWLGKHRGTGESPTWQRHLLFGLVFFVLMLLPILGFIPISYMRITWVADHFLYTPLIAVVALVAGGIASWHASAKPQEQYVALVTGATLLAALGYSSFRHSYFWANEDALWSHTIAGHPDPCRIGCGCWQAHNRLGARKFDRGDVDGGFYHFTQSTRLRPDLGETHNNLGSALASRGRVDDAIREFSEACRLCPQVPIMRVNLANTLLRAGRVAEAAEQFAIVARKEPRNPALRNNLGVLYHRLGNKERAVEEFRAALELRPDFKEAREGLAVALGERPVPADVPGAPPGSSGPQLVPEPPARSTLGPMPLAVPPQPGSSFDPLGLKGS